LTDLKYGYGSYTVSLRKKKWNQAHSQGGQFHVLLFHHFYQFIDF
jgi:hypothetical protein